ncbi:MAG: hypothetical protein JXQ23_10255 [Clostridia bacterium]|nr:hypothetical protein [Clostridia bacterium]
MRKRKSVLLLFVVLVILSLFLVSCELPELDTAVLNAGQDIDVGDVIVTNNASHIYVGYQLDADIAEEGWEIIEMHLAVVQTLEELPVNKAGNPLVGQFEFSRIYSFGDGIYEDYFEVMLPEEPDDDHYFIAAHALIARYNEDLQMVETESAWGNGTRFVTKGNWATYFEYDLYDQDFEVNPE